MQDIEIHTARRGFIINAVVFCFFTIVIVLLLTEILFSGDSQTPKGGMVVVTGFFLLIDIFALFGMDHSRSSISLRGTQLTARDGKILKSEVTIDLAHLNHVGADFGAIHYNFGSSMLRLPYLALRTTDGGYLRIFLNYYKREDIMRMLPLITNIVQRPDVQKVGPFKKVLSIWFGSQAPEPVGVEKAKFFSPPA